MLIPGTHRSIGEPVVVNSDGFAGAEVMENGDDLWRIVAIGDSNTFGSGSLHDSYPAVLERILGEAAQPGRRYGVVNAGIPGLDSMEAPRRLRAKVLSPNSQVATTYIGWNDLMKIDPLGERRIPAVSQASRFVDRLWLVTGMRTLTFLQLQPHINLPAMRPESRSGLFADFVPTPTSRT